MKSPQGGSGLLGVVLLQLGGPESLDDVQPFLESMFRDPDLFDLPVPAWLRSSLARWLSAWRAAKARPLYESIGGKSPIGDLTRRQAELLEQSLRPSLPCRVFVAMRYGAASSEVAIEAVRRAGCDRLLLLPLYPHYSAATTGSSFREWERCCAGNDLQLPTERIDSYFSVPAYIAAVALRIDEALARFAIESRPHVVLSAHGLPKKFIRKGDPYQHQIEETTRLVLRRCSADAPHTLCYQSRVGPQEWLKPSLTETLRRLGRDGTDSVLVVPISFVSDHLETLSEIDIEAREEAARWGIVRFETMEALNDSPAFIAALTEIVMNRAFKNVGV